MVTDAPELLNGTYEAFKARKHQEFDQQHGGKPHHAQQKLLRVHLRHFLLTMRSQLDGDELQTGICTDSDKKQSDRAFLSEQKRLAIAREMLRAERQRAARVLQSFLRRRLATKILHEKELPSTSEFVAVPRERKAAVLPDARPIAAKIEDVARTSSLSRAALPPYEVVAQVIAARDLALTSPVSGHSGDRFVEAELVLKGKTGEMARVVSPKQFLETLQDGDIQWQGFTLRFAIDPGDSARISPESVVDDWSASIELNITGTSGIEATLGVVEIPLSLLNTPLASQYALCRWFPLEKTHAGHATRGELRVSVCYLMRQKASSEGEVCDTMVPFVSTACSKDAQKESQKLQERKRNTITRKSQASAISSRNAPEKQARANSTTMDKLKKQKPPRLSLKHSMAGPIGRISRAEALSPPPSPSSITSSEASEDAPDADGQISLAQMKSERRILLPKRQQKFSKPTIIRPPQTEQVVNEEPSSTQPPAKPASSFLKRKPYKVVFEKLDWSGVTSKTDSNLTTNGSRAKSSCPSRSANASRSARRAEGSSVRTDKGGNVARKCKAETRSDFASDSSSSVLIGADTIEQPTPLETAVYERCGVTRETASLARFKYQKERKSFVAALREQAHDRTNGNTDAESDQQLRQESGEHQVLTVLDDTVTELWRRLTGDSSGQLYASMLRRFTNQQSITTSEVIEASVAN